jgi:hypothetical protein
MRRKSCFRIISAPRVVLAGAFLFLLQSTLPGAAGQELQPTPPAAAQEPPTPVAAQESRLPVTIHDPANIKKVWTNDDLESERSPMDQYLVDKETREAADAAQAAADAIASEKAMAGLKTPATVEETQRAIDDTQQDIHDQNDALDRLNKELQSAPDVQKAGIQREIDRHTTGVQTSQQDLKVLQDHLRQLNRKSSSENPADSGKQPSQ